MLASASSTARRLLLLLLTTTAPCVSSGADLAATDLSAGSTHTCALTAQGGVLCWGDNLNGQLGHSSQLPSSVPVPVPGLGSGIEALAASQNFQCALASAGGVLCWGGWPFAGGPAPVPGLESGVVAIDAGGALLCALTAGGGVVCDSYAPPIFVPGLESGATAITVGGSFGCAIVAGGAVRCWGRNDYGQIGDGSATTYSEASVPVAGLAEGVVALSSAGRHTCALRVDRTVWCWGSNWNGEIGDAAGGQLRVATPVPIADLPRDVVGVAAGGWHTCVWTSSGTVWCWGQNEYGQLGNAAVWNSGVPVPVTGLTGARDLSAGFFHTCALTSANGVTCWGNNRLGQAGTGSMLMSSEPVAVPGLPDPTTSLFLSESLCAVASSGFVWCWGGFHWRGPEAYTGDYGSPVPDIADFKGGVWLTTYGWALRWGETFNIEAVATGVEAIDSGRLHACALRTTGDVQCWGSNGDGQLGNGTTQASYYRVAVQGLAGGVAAIALGDNHSCALTESGGALCWGDGRYGQLGNGSTADRTAPVAVGELGSGVAALDAGATHTCAVLADGGVKCWGRNDYGQIGDGTTSDRALPVVVSGLANAVAVTAGTSHSCALLLDGGMRCWGRNHLGQLGDGSFADHHAPVEVVGISGGVSSIYAGRENSCVATSDGSVLCWGTNLSGELGDGSSLTVPTPLPVVGFGGAPALPTLGTPGLLCLAGCLVALGAVRLRPASPRL